MRDLTVVRVALGLSTVVDLAVLESDGAVTELPVPLEGGHVDHHIRAAFGLAAECGDGILLCRHDKKGRDVWLLPGGGVHSGETNCRFSIFVIARGFFPSASTM